MKFEWDNSKNESNIEKHGVSFDVVNQFDFNSALEISYDRNGEQRTTAYGLVGNRVYCLVYTYRSTAIRVISLRKANKREVKYYVEQS